MVGVCVCVCDRGREESFHPPRIGYLDHLHQKSYGGPPIHRVIQILSTFKEQDAQVRHYQTQYKSFEK